MFCSHTVYSALAVVGSAAASRADVATTSVTTIAITHEHNDRRYRNERRDTCFPGGGFAMATMLQHKGISRPYEGAPYADDRAEVTGADSHRC